MNSVEMLKENAVVDIQIGTQYYKRLQELMTYYNQLVPVSEIIEQTNCIMEDRPLSEWGTHMQTLLILINEIEQKARTQGHVELVDFKTTED